MHTSHRGLEKDFQIRLKFGMSAGHIIKVHEDIAGTAWDHCCVFWVEDLAEVGEILVTKAIRDRIEENEFFSATFEARSSSIDDDDAEFEYYNMQPVTGVK